MDTKIVPNLKLKDENSDEITKNSIDNKNTTTDLSIGSKIEAVPFIRIAVPVSSSIIPLESNTAPVPGKIELNGAQNESKISESAEKNSIVQGLGETTARTGNETVAKSGKKANTIGPFNIIKELGKGSFATIYLSELKNKKIALKVASKTDKDAIEALLTEKKALNIIYSTSHQAQENIIHLLSYYEDEFNLCLALSYIPNGELFDFVMDKGKCKVENRLGLPIDYSKRIMKDLLGGN